VGGHDRQRGESRPAGDLALTELDGTGLPVASVVRTARIAALEANDATRPGRVRPDVREPVRRAGRKRQALACGGRSLALGGALRDPSALGEGT